MTNVKQSFDKTQKISQYSDLAVKIGLPVSHLFEELSGRLNKKGARPKRLNRFTYNVIQNVYYGKYEDEGRLVETEMEEMVAEKLGVSEKLKPHFDAIREALAA
jgi:hypothetical protein